MGALTLTLLLASAAAALAASPPAAAGSAQIVLASRVVDKTPDGRSLQFGSQDSVYCWTRVHGENGRSIKHIWKRNGRVIREMSLKIGADDYRTWSRKDTLWPGHWTVAVEDEDGRPLGPEMSFIVADAFEAGPGYTVEIRDVSPSRLEAVLIAADTAALSAYTDDAGAVQDLLPGEHPVLTLRPPQMPESQDTFDLSFEARVLDAKKAPHTLTLGLHKVPNPSRLEDWASTRKRLLAAADNTRAAR
jgi:hypothetical protein